MTAYRRSRISFFYLAGYLIPTGLALLIAPRPVMRLLLSNGEYGDIMPRLAGTMILALGIFIVQLMRHRIDVFYTTAIFVRIIISASLLWLFFRSWDPFFLAMLGVVMIGMIWTTVSYTLDKREQSRSTKS